MHDTTLADSLLVARFADFYEEIARIKLAIQEGRLPLYLSGRGQSASAGGAELAAMVSGRLYERLVRGAKIARASATAAETKAHVVAQYAMAALADEIFVLELDWPGRAAWLDYLLEFSLFRSRSAGRQFFVTIDQLLEAPARGSQQVELAAVFLIALALGFKGQYRGPHGVDALKRYRERLLGFIAARTRVPVGQAAFPQAYRHLLREPEAKRLAPLTRWYLAGAVAAGVYLVASTLVWVALVGPFYEKFEANNAERAMLMERR